MPIYEYICQKCGNQFESLVSVGKENNITCPYCKNRQVQKILSSFGIGGGSNRVSMTSSACSTCTSASCKTCK